MPFVTIEIPENRQFSLLPFALEINQYLAEVLNVPIEKCKVKLVRLPEVFVGKGTAEDSYARLRVEMMSGRDREKLRLAGKEIVQRFAQAFRSQNPGKPCRITMDFHEIDRELLFVAADE